MGGGGNRYDRLPIGPIDGLHPDGAWGDLDVMLWWSAKRNSERFQTTAWAACCVWALWFGAKQLTPQQIVRRGKEGAESLLAFILCDARYR